MFIPEGKVKKDILEYLKKENKPVSMSEIFAYAAPTIELELLVSYVHQLIANKLVKEEIDKFGRRKYRYALS